MKIVKRIRLWWTYRERRKALTARLVSARSQAMIMALHDELRRMDDRYQKDVDIIERS